MTSVLTDEEKLRVFRNKSQYAFDSDAGQIEIFDLAAEAVIRKLSAGVSVEPVAEIIECSVMGQQTIAEIEGRWKFMRIGEKMYDKYAIAAARVQENERCAKFADELDCAHKCGVGGELGNKLRALLGKEAT